MQGRMRCHKANKMRLRGTASHDTVSPKIMEKFCLFTTTREEKEKVPISTSLMTFITDLALTSYCYYEMLVTVN